MTTPVSKTYHTRHANSTFVVQKYDEQGKPLTGQCEVLQFHGKDLVTSDPQAIRQLDEAADKPASPIYTTKPNAMMEALEKAAVKQVVDRAGDVVEQLAKAGQRA
jgi:hypothetical protein